ncbi:flagellar protein export ATPase FliI [Natronospirillum operosum]|nr:flagellar protein export ATPase FliI [Natronospirillum operosum]
MSRLAEALSSALARVPEQPELPVSGKLTRLVGLTLEASGLAVSVGDRCLVRDGLQSLEAEVVGFTEDKTYLMPVQAMGHLRAGAEVVPIASASELVIGEELLGRVVNGFGEPIDTGEPLLCRSRQSLHGEYINPMHRQPIREPLDVGIKAINALLSVGRGQRLGLFAGSGVGKSVLLGMMTRFTNADIIVVGLIGERGREVKEFIDEILGEEGLSRSVVVASPADDPPLLRLRAAQYATAIAEYYRAQGKNVLLLMDSLTRYAQAQREIALAIGEPPATKGYPPSVFARLPSLVERAGNGEKGGGSITAFYTVLTEGDDQQDPVADSARAILDGHVVLARRLAEQGHYPAIDIEASISRAMPQVVTESHLQSAQTFKQFFSRYQQSQDLISIGAYTEGQDQELDTAVRLMPDMRGFLRQGLQEKFDFATSAQQMQQLVGSAGAAGAGSKPARGGQKNLRRQGGQRAGASGGIKPMPKRPAGGGADS